jgi:hypothetical protein
VSGALLAHLLLLRRWDAGPPCCHAAGLHMPLEGYMHPAAAAAAAAAAPEPPLGGWAWAG